MAKSTALCLSLICVPMMAYGKINIPMKAKPALDCSSAYQQNNYTEALIVCQKEAEAGDPSAHTMLGLLTHRGLGIPKNDREAYDHFQFAAQRGNVVAQFHLAKLIVTNTVSEPDEQQAFQWFEKSAQQQYAPGEFLLAICYRLGIGVSPNLNESEHWYNLAKSHGIGTAAQTTIIQPVTNTLMPTEDPHQAYLLGKAYLTGEGQQQDDALAFDYFQEAAQKNHPDAQAYLAWMLALGLGGQSDLPRAIYWFKAANKLQLSAHQTKQYTLAGLSKRATPRMPDQQFALGRTTLESAINEQEVERGLALLHMAAEEKHPGAQYYLSQLYHQGKHVPQSIEIAFDYAQKAALGGNPDAQYALGWFYANGMGTERNLTKADEWFEKAHRNGHRQAKSSHQFVKHQIAMQTVAQAPVKQSAPAQPERASQPKKVEKATAKLQDLTALYHRKLEEAKLKRIAKRENAAPVAINEATVAKQEATVARKEAPDATIAVKNTPVEETVIAQPAKKGPGFLAQLKAEMKGFTTAVYRQAESLKFKLTGKKESAPEVALKESAREVAFVEAAQSPVATDKNSYLYTDETPKTSKNK